MPKIQGNTLAEHRVHIRTQLFDALAALISEHGYDSITLADIAARAAVGRTAVYNHFPDKESVLLAMAAEQTHAYLDRLTAELDRHDDPLERLAVFIRAQISELSGHHVPMTAISSALSDRARVAMREHVTPLITILERLIQDASAANVIAVTDVSSAAQLVSAAASGRYVDMLPGGDVEATAETVVDFVLHGLRAGTAS